VLTLTVSFLSVVSVLLFIIDFWFYYLNIFAVVVASSTSATWRTQLPFLLPGLHLCNVLRGKNLLVLFSSEHIGFNFNRRLIAIL